MLWRHVFHGVQRHLQKSENNFCFVWGVAELNFWELRRRTSVAVRRIFYFSSFRSGSEGSQRNPQKLGLLARWTISIFGQHQHRNLEKFQYLGRERVNLNIFTTYIWVSKFFKFYFASSPFLEHEQKDATRAQRCCLRGSFPGAGRSKSVKNSFQCSFYLVLIIKSRHTSHLRHACYVFFFFFIFPHKMFEQPDFRF